MCDACGQGEGDETKWKSPPNTAARIAEIKEHQRQVVMDQGHQVAYIFGEIDKPAFAYTVGRSLFDKVDLLLTGSLPPEQAMAILNAVAELDSTGKIDVRALGKAGQPVSVEGFDSQLWFLEANPVTGQMNQAIGFAGGHIHAVQVIWPDADGRWPNDPEFAYGTDAQPLYPLFD